MVYWTNRILIYLVISTVVLSCSTEDDVISDELRQLIQDDISLFENSADTPGGLNDLYESNRVLVFGETHYVQEHQDFIISQLPALSDAGYRTIFQESFHCFTWMLEDYISGEISELPEFLLYFDNTLIEGIKNYNAAVHDSLKFELIYMDVNHWDTNFVICLDEIELILGGQDIFVDIKNISTDSEDYIQELQRMKAEIESNLNSFTNLWGEKWLDRILEIISFEIESVEYRLNRSDTYRESLMSENILNVMSLAENTNEKFLVNTGSYHAQLITYMGVDIDRLARRLKEEENKTSSIAFIGIRGERKEHFYDETNKSFDLIDESSSDNILNEIDRLASNNMSYLSLSNNIFSEQKIKIRYVSGVSINEPIGTQFDAIITYPSITTLQSMDIYDWN